jgi:hypothetical protein
LIDPARNEFIVVFCPFRIFLLKDCGKEGAQSCNAIVPDKKTAP